MTYLRPTNPFVTPRIANAYPHVFPDRTTNNDLRIQYADAHAKHFYVNVSGGDWVGIERNMAPAVALQILKAAGWTRQTCDDVPGFGRLGLAVQYLEGFEQWRLEEGKWLERKDEITNRLVNPMHNPSHPTNWTYASTTDVVRRAVDVIIDLEKKAEEGK